MSADKALGILKEFTGFQNVGLWLRQGHRFHDLVRGGDSAEQSSESGASPCDTALSGGITADPGRETRPSDVWVNESFMAALILPNLFSQPVEASGPITSLSWPLPRTPGSLSARCGPQFAGRRIPVGSR